MQRDVKGAYKVKPVMSMKVRILPAGGTFEQLGSSHYSEKHLNELPEGRWDLRAYRLEGKEVGEQAYGRENASTDQVKAIIRDKYSSGKVNPNSHAVYLRAPTKQSPVKVRLTKGTRDFSELDALASGELE